MVMVYEMRFNINRVVCCVIGGDDGDGQIHESTKIQSGKKKKKGTRWIMIIILDPIGSMLMNGHYQIQQFLNENHGNDGLAREETRTIITR